MRLSVWKGAYMNKQDGYIPSFFLGMFCLRENVSDERQISNEFVTVAKVRPDISITTKSFIIHLMHSGGAWVAVDHENDITLLLHGEIFNTPETNQAEFLIKQFRKHGLSFSKDINGSFVVLVIDKRNDTVAVVTDRINSRKVFYSKYKGSYWLSTSLYLHPTADVDIDTVGVTCYLANGAIFNNRTLFEDVRILERACLHKLSSNGFDTTKYWYYEFSNSYSNTDEIKLQAELSELLIESIRVRLKNKSKAFLSLSAGYDSTGILGILASKLNFSNVECFSYCFGVPKPGSDEYISKEMANYLGFGHKIVKSYNGDFLDLINHNASMGQGLANFCDEIDAWKTLAPELSAERKSVLFVGDMYSSTTCYKLKCNLNDLNEVLPYVGIYNSLILKPYVNLLDSSNGKILREAWDEEYRSILRKIPHYDDIRDSKDFVYFDQRIPHILTCWREYFQSPFVNVCAPYLDSNVLDFTMKLPVSLRESKILYKRTLNKMFPDLFKFKRAHTSGTVNWRRELIGQYQEVKGHILSYDSKLDEIIRPEIILNLLKKSKSWKHSRYGPRSLPIKISQKYLNDMRIGNMIIKYFPVIDLESLLKRILVMRQFLSRVGNSSDAERTKNTA